MIILDMMDSYPRKTHKNTQGEKSAGDNKSSLGKFRSSLLVSDLANQRTPKINTRNRNSQCVDDKSSEGLNFLSRIFNGLRSLVCIVDLMMTKDEQPTEKAEKTK